MALTVETGAIVSGANSYVSEAEYQTWADARFGAARSTAPANDSAAEALILRAMDYFESLDFIGEKSEETQPLQWPRSWVVIDGYAVETSEIPNEVKNAIYELTYAEEQGVGMNENIERIATSETVGPISISYSSSTARTTIPAVGRALRKLLVAGGGMRVFRI